jgi:hypothetical protein
MMPRFAAAVCLAVLLIISPGLRAAEPAKDDSAKKDDATTAGALEVRANAEFSAGNWAAALPMLKKVAELVKDDAARLSNVEEQIRVCERNMAKMAAENLKNRRPGDAPPPGATPPAAPPTAENRKPLKAPKPGEALELTIKELGNFDYDQEKGGNIPDDIKALAGSTVRVRGYMIPMDQAENITQFALVPDLFACCFGQPPQVQHTIVSHCPPGKAVSYFADEIVVEGKLKVDEKKDDGFIVSVFEVDISSVRPAPK